MKNISASLVCAVLMCGAYVHGQTISSGVYDRASGSLGVVSPAQISVLFDGSSDVFEDFYVATVSVEAGQLLPLPRDNELLETLLIIETGTLSQVLPDGLKKIGHGSVALIMPGEKIQFTNAGSDLAMAYVVMWRAKDANDKSHKYHSGNARSQLIDWDEVSAVQIERGERRYLIDAPTTMLNRFKMHVTTLNEGMTSHPPHTHVEEEIIIVRRGDVEEIIDGVQHMATAGSVIFLRSKVSHGLKNVGKGRAEYYAFKWEPK